LPESSDLVEAVAKAEAGNGLQHDDRLAEKVRNRLSDKEKTVKVSAAVTY